MKTPELELLVAEYFNWRKNIILSNIYYGFLSYEADMLLITRNKYLWEIELKVSKSDLRNESKKEAFVHNDHRIKRLYFAMPEYVLEEMFLDEEYIPDDAGILLCRSNGRVYPYRHAKDRKARKLTVDEYMELCRLGVIRNWSLKRKIYRLEQRHV